MAGANDHRRSGALTPRAPASICLLPPQLPWLYMRYVDYHAPISYGGLCWSDPSHFCWQYKQLVPSPGGLRGEGKRRSRQCRRGMCPHCPRETGVTVPGASAVLRSVLDRDIVRGKLCTSLPEYWDASNFVILSQSASQTCLRDTRDVLGMWNTQKARSSRLLGASAALANGCLLSQVITGCHSEYGVTVMST